MKKAVVTITSGSFHEQMSLITHPSIKAYAEKLGADFIVWSDFSGHRFPHYKKIELGALLDVYDRVLYLDTDILVRDDAPDIFELVPEDQLGVLDEGRYVDRTVFMVACMLEMGIDPSKHEWTYYNTGVMVLSKRHQAIFVQPKVESDYFKEQTFLNVMICLTKTPTFSLPYRFNRFLAMSFNYGEERWDCYFLHYAAFSFLMSNQDQLKLMAGDLAVWQARKPHYHFPRHFLFIVQGDLAEEVAAEPAIRFAKEVMYHGDEIVIVTSRPEVFRHLEIPIYGKREEVPGGGIYGRFRPCYTQQDPDDRHLRPMFRDRIHAVNVCSITALGVELPPAYKTPGLAVDPQALAALTQTTGGSDLSKLVLLHPGRGATSKTFPADVWQSYADILIENDYPVAVIGGGPDQESVVEFNRSRCLDLVGKLSTAELIALVSQAKVLVSNDSAPVAIAGAFHGWIGLIATTRAPEYVLPWRNGSQRYRAWNLERLGLYHDRDRPALTLGPSLSDDCTDDRLRECLPDPATILQFVREAVDSAEH